VNSKKKIRVTIVAPGPQSEGGIRSVVARILPRLEAHEELEVVWLASQRSGSAAAKLFCLLKSLVKALYYLPKSDVVHVHGTVGLSLLRKSVFIWLARMTRCHVIFHFHAPQAVFEQFFAKPGFLRSYSRHTLKQCDALVVLSESWGETVGSEFPESNIVVIYNPVAESLGASKSDLAVPRNVLYLAHLIKRKGYDDLIQAFALVAESVPDAQLIFCGSGEVEQAQRLCADLGIANRVEFRGWISEKEKTVELARAAVFCLPSYDEGLPMGILEAMSSGVAIVTTPVGGVPDVLSHEGNALLVDPGDIDNLGRQLSRLLTDVQLRDRLSNEALRDSDKFHPDRIAGHWVELYRSITGATDR
jgi:glycosyltransferase involved in cell wall biosynthesis